MNYNPYLFRIYELSSALSPTQILLWLYRLYLPNDLSRTKTKRKYYSERKLGQTDRRSTDNNLRGS